MRRLGMEFYAETEMDGWVCLAATRSTARLGEEQS